MRVITLILGAVAAVVRFLRDILFGVFSLVFLAGIGILGYQAYLWLKYGDWLALPLSVLFDAVAPLNRWLIDPQSWYGLHEFVSGTLAFVPLAFFCLVVGFCGAFVLECLDAPRQRGKALWEFLNTPVVVLLLFALFLGHLASSWQAQQTTREAYREASHYTLESIHRLNTVLENLPQQAKVEASTWARAWEALRGEPAAGFWASFTPLFPEFKAQHTAQLLYYLQLRFPRERRSMRSITAAVKRLETFLTSEVRPGAVLSAEQQQELATLRERLRRAVSVLETFLGY